MSGKKLFPICGLLLLFNESVVGAEKSKRLKKKVYSVKLIVLCVKLKATLKTYAEAYCPVIPKANNNGAGVSAEYCSFKSIEII